MILKVLFISLHIIALDCFTHRKQLPSTYSKENETWTGKWFPAKPDFLNDNFRSAEKNITIEVTPQVDDVVEISSSFCDDGQTNLIMDWDDDPSDFICLTTERYSPNFEKPPLLELYNVPKAYKPYPECMNVSITYDEDIPTFGNHRIVWPKYGEYEYIPRQRWLHTVEHGGIVMLYHPCADEQQVNKLQRLVRKCLYRHVITPSRMLSPEMPLALISWGRRLQMSFVQKETIVDFIKSNALKGLEHPSKDGEYAYGLLEKAEIISDFSDSTLCPGL